jgi:uncharacterized membrane protein YjfL (UPF0719 family)
MDSSNLPRTADAQARWLSRAGLVLAFATFLPATVRPALTLQPSVSSLTAALAFTGVALVAFFIATTALNQALLRGRLRGEIRRGNLAAGVVAAAHAAGTGIVVAHCFAADALSNLPVGAIFFAVAEISLVLLSILFRALTAYADDEEIAGGNVAAAVSYSGLVIALSLIVGHAADGSFVGWLPALRSFAIFLSWAVLLYPVRQIVIARGLLGFPLVWRGGQLDRLVAQEHNGVVSTAEAIGYLAAAFLALGIA